MPTHSTHTHTHPLHTLYTPHTASGSRRGTAPNATSQGNQLQQYRQRLVQMHQQLVNGQQQLKELNKLPDKQQQVHWLCS